MLWVIGLLSVLGAAYANHFHNGSHFDDLHTIQDNVAIRSPRNIPRFFTDSSTFSALKTHQVYRPALTATLAVDWAAGKGDPFPFHVTSFAFYLVYLAAVYSLNLRLLGERYWAFAATALYGLHPVCAETVNYIIQRGEILSTLGVVAGLSLCLWRPAWRPAGLYLIPVVLALLSKPPALVFPLLLFGAVYFWDTDRNGRQALKQVTPALLVCAATGLLLSHMTGPVFTPGDHSPALYRITQMRVALHYFTSWFAPVHLSADSDWQVLPGILDPQALAGFAFLVLVAAVILWAARGSEDLRPIAYGLIWFLVALFPTSWMMLAEVANDHRMFFPFFGLALFTCGALRLLLQKAWTQHRAVRAGTTILLCLVAVAEARATAQRNQVWRSDETLWRDVTQKSPRNGRGWMNYGRELMARGDAPGALACFERALPLSPNYYLLEINLGVAKAALARPREAEQHFRRALQLEPERYQSHLYFSQWLFSAGRTAEALEHAQLAVRYNPNAIQARYLLMQLQQQLAQWKQLEALAQDTLRVAPGDATATAYLEKARHPPPSAETPESLLALSLSFYTAGRYEDCIIAARGALRLRPDYAEAFNNIAAAHIAMRRWDEGIRAADQALRINPQYERAKNNRLWALAQKQAGSAK